MSTVLRIRRRRRRERDEITGEKCITISSAQRAGDDVEDIAHLCKLKGSGVRRPDYREQSPQLRTLGEAT